MAETIKPLGVQPITLRKIILWRREVDSRPGALANVLEPFVNTKPGGIRMGHSCRLL